MLYFWTESHDEYELVESQGTVGESSKVAPDYLRVNKGLYRVHFVAVIL